MNYASVLDNASKAAAGVGVILGLSYAAGLFKMLGFYSSLNAGWVFDLTDIQGFTNEGLPIVMLLLAATLFFLLGLNEMRDFRYRRLALAGSFTLSVVLGWVVLPYLVDTANYNIFLYVAALIGVGGAAWLASLLHDYVQPGKAQVSVFNLGLRLNVILVVFPAIIGCSLASDIKYARESATEVVNEHGRILGMLVRVVGGKYLLLDCNVKYQMTIIETSSSLKLRRSSGRCNAML